MPSRDEQERGLARERTGLAWERSALAYAVLAAVVLGAAAHRNAPGLIVLSLALFVCALAVWRHGIRAYERPGAPPQARTLALMSSATALTAVTAAIVVAVAR
jgi:uncharacterized membrane protein YidH (DUF202 family)